MHMKYLGQCLVFSNHSTNYSSLQFIFFFFLSITVSMGLGQTNTMEVDTYLSLLLPLEG